MSKTIHKAVIGEEVNVYKGNDRVATLKISSVKTTISVEINGHWEMDIPLGTFYRGFVWDPISGSWVNKDNKDFID